VFNGFEVNENDPFYIPLNNEQIEEDGAGDILVAQPSKVIIESVRKRKGLVVDTVLVTNADKERTITKNK
jgi:ribosome assembly protein 1